MQSKKKLSLINDFFRYNFPDFYNYIKNIHYLVSNLFIGIYLLTCLLIGLTFFHHLIELLIPKQWHGKYHAFMIRLYSYFHRFAQGWDFVLTILFRLDLNRAKLSGANLSGLNLSDANFINADLRGAILEGANLSNASFSHADLRGAILIGANLSNANLYEANLVGAFVYAISAWNVNLEKTIQENLIITRPNEPLITVDNLEVAQFIYLLLNNKKIREAIDSITSKIVLILGRFTPERKIILDALRDELRDRNYVPILFDFEKPVSRDFTETVRTLAHLSRFILADLTDPSSIPQELQAIVPDLAVPVQPLLHEAKREYSMFVDFRKHDWVLPTYLYKDRESLIASLQDEIIESAEKKARELAIEKAKRLEKP